MEVKERLLQDVSKIGITVPFELDLRGYSKTCFGRYDPNVNKVIIYPHKNKKGELYPYQEILCTVVHECIHCMQWHNPLFIRYKGIMHDAEFKKLYSKYSNRAKARVLLSEVCYDSKDENSNS